MIARDAKGLSLVPMDEAILGKVQLIVLSTPDHAEKPDVHSNCFEKYRGGPRIITEEDNITVDEDQATAVSSRSKLPTRSLAIVESITMHGQEQDQPDQPHHPDINTVGVATMISPYLIHVAVLRSDINISTSRLESDILVTWRDCPCVTGAP